MSSNSSLSNEEIIESLKDDDIGSYCYLAAAGKRRLDILSILFHGFSALIFYEHFITLDREIVYIWRYRMTGVTALILLNRCILLLFGSMYLLSPFYWTSAQSCEAQVIIPHILYISSYIVVASFSALRVYAITKQKWHLTLLALFTGLVPAATSLYVYVHQSYAFVQYVGNVPVCVTTGSITASTYNRIVIVTRTCAILSNVVVVAATWFYTITRMFGTPNIKTKSTTMSLLFRNGIVYFIILLLLDILQIVTELDIINTAAWQIDEDYVTLFLPPISGILISRFMFNLRQNFDVGRSLGDSRLPSFMTPQESDEILSGSMDFTSRLIGNMGAPLDHGESNGSPSDDGEYDGKSSDLNISTQHLAAVSLVMISNEAQVADGNTVPHGIMEVGRDQIGRYQ